MKKFAPKNFAFFLPGLLGVLISASAVFAAESTYDLENPFFLPQTAFLVGNVDYTVELSNSVRKSTSRLNEAGINTYGFDLEVNANSFMNIGAYFKVESQGVDTDQMVDHQFTTLLGVFTRFFYVPPFLKGRVSTTGFFLRLELGGGPVILNGPSGLTAQGGAYVGIETHLSKWLGISFSYGQSVELGKETLISSGDYSNSEYANINGYKDATIWSHGRVVALALKTTFF